jgi:hypothetical protein
MPRSRRKRRPGRARRNLFLFGLAVAALVVLIGVVALAQRGPQSIMPPESAEIAEKRTSPGNAFYTLREAWQLLPALPPPVKVPRKDEPESKEFYYPESRSIAKLMGIHCPDDDPALAKYLAACGPAIAMTREALDMDFFLYPEVGTPLTCLSVDGQDYGREIGRMANVLTGCMHHTARFTGDDEKVIEYFADALRLGDMLAEDGGIIHYSIATGAKTSALRHMADAAAHVESPKFLRAVLADIQSLDGNERSMQPYLEYSWRTLDNWADQRFNYGQGRGMGTRVSEFWLTWQFKRHRRSLRENRDALFAAAELPHAELASRLNSDLAHLHVVAHPYFAGIDEIRALPQIRARFQNAVAGVSIALAVELYRRDHGCCPESLDALSPDYLESVPVDSYEGDPFTYRLEDGDYWLYDASCAAMKKEHRMRAEAFHCPSMESAE